MCGLIKPISEITDVLDHNSYDGYASEVTQARMSQYTSEKL